MPESSDNQEADALRRAIEDRGGLSWVRRTREPLMLRGVGAPLGALAIALVAVFVLVFGALAVWSGEIGPGGVAKLKVTAGVGAAALLFLGGFALVFRQWHDSLPGAALNSERARMADGRPPPPGAVKGVITAARHADLPAVVWKTASEPQHRRLTVTSQAFVVTSGDDRWLIDSRFVEPARDWPNTEGRVGDEVWFFPDSDELVHAPRWAEASAGSVGYRSRRIRRLAGTAASPMRLIFSREATPTATGDRTRIAVDPSELEHDVEHMARDEPGEDSVRRTDRA